jgi:hypothetical protein
VAPKNPSKPWWLLPAGRLSPWWWAGVAAVVLILDDRVALDVRMPSVAMIPVLLAAWYTGASAAAVLAIGLAVGQVAFVLLRSAPDALTTALLALVVVRGTLILLIGLWLARLADHERALEGRVRSLEGLLPICSFCKNIRNDAGEWERLEAYIAKRSDAKFSHGLCPDCRKTHFSEFI